MIGFLVGAACTSMCRYFDPKAALAGRGGCYDIDDVDGGP
jgi:hypothetical protein